MNQQKSNANDSKNIDFTNNLNEEQLAVVNNLSGNMLILAGAVFKRAFNPVRIAISNSKVADYVRNFRLHTSGIDRL